MIRSLPILALLCLGPGLSQAIYADQVTEQITAAARASPQFVSATESQAILRADPNIIVIDVRTPREYRHRRITGSENLNFYARSFRQDIRQLDPTATYLIHCKSGVRSSRALQLFKEAGFTNLIHLDGGIDDWIRHGLPVETG